MLTEFLFITLLAGVLSYSIWITHRFRSYRKREAHSCHDNEEYLKAIMANTPDHILIQDKDLKYVLVVNPQLGLTVDDMLSKTDAEFLAPDDAAKLTEIKNRVLQTGQAATYAEIPLISKEGKQEYFAGSYIPTFEEDGRVSGLIGYFRNVTAVKIAEAERLAREKAEAANHAKDIFLATLSHELRTPLTAILAWAQLLNSKKLDQTKTSVGLQSIEKNARAQSRIIEDLLDVSRIAAGKLELKRESTDLVSIIREAIETVQLESEKKSITIFEDLGNVPIFVFGDQERLKQVVWNLLTNSIKFTQPSGKIEVALRATESRGKHSAEILVRDNGKGIRAEFIPHVFERFSQAESSIGREQKGLGLGLSLVRSLIELHQGSVAVESPGENKGTTIKVTLPLPEELSNHGQPIQNASSSSKTA